MKRKNLPLLLILAIGILTPLASTALFFVWRPAAQTNNGEILPPAPLPEVWRTADGADFSAADWRGYWVLLTAADGGCGADCELRLCQLRQLRLLLPGHYLRLRRAWLVTDATPPPQQIRGGGDCGAAASEPALQARVTEEDFLDGVEILFGGADTLPAAQQSPADYIYLIDPSGLWAMRFAPELSTYEMRKDLRGLLKLSKGRKLKQ